MVRIKPVHRSAKPTRQGAAIKSVKEYSSGVKIKKLRITPSAGKVFQRVYEKGHPEKIPLIKENVRKFLSGFESVSVLIYAFTGGGFVFIGKVIPSFRKQGDFNEETGDTEIEKAVIAEVESKLKNIIIQIAARELGEKNFSGEIQEISINEAARLTGAEPSLYAVDAVCGKVIIQGQK